MKIGHILGLLEQIFRCRVKAVRLLVLGVLFASQALCREASPAKEEISQPSASEKEEKKNEPRIGAGDRILVKIFPEDEFVKGGETQVSSDGEIALSLLGKIKVEGITTGEAEKKIGEILGRDYLVSPVVVVEFVKRNIEEEKNSVSVLGQVQKPGSYDIPPDQKLTLLKVISMAGGFTDIANPKRIKVVRKEGGKTHVIRANAESVISGKSPDIELQSGDVINVAESFF